MAIYHLHCDIIGRSGGRSATAAAAYRATCKIEDRTTGETFDFSKKEKALYTAIYHKGEIPQWAKNRSELWNSCEEKENRKNSQFCRSFDIALMKELSQEQNIELLQKWLYQNYVSRGLVADVAIHAPHKNRDGTTNENLHAHILIPTRKINSDGWTEKDREGNDHEFLRKVRKSWADIVNQKFKELGMSERIDERTLEEQGIDREPQQHQGVTATAMERKGKTVRRKKYKDEPEQTPHEIAIDEILVNSALHCDPEFIKLSKLKDTLNSSEYVAEQRFSNLVERIEEKGGGRKTTNEALTFVRVEQVFHYVQQNSKSELEYWQGRKSSDWRDKVFNQGIDEKIQTVKKIAQHPNFDAEIYPPTKQYYEDIQKYGNSSHFDKFKRWAETTDFLPVKILRTVRNKLMEWRDQNYPKNQSQEQKHYQGRK